MIELQHITKRFGPFAALDDVSVAIGPGEILGLLGENGAGKSTLMNVLFGLVRPDSGEIVVRGTPVRVASPRVARRLGIGMVHQHFKLVPTLTGVENLSLFLPGRRRELQVAAALWLERLRWAVPLGVAVERLTVGQQQRVEILKALLAIERHGQDKSQGTLILDEPTAVLTPQETAELFAALMALRAAGTAVVFISHKLQEVRKICDRIAILRRGKLVHAGAAAELSAETMAEKMVGSQVTMPRVQAARQVQGEALLKLTNVTAGQLRDVSLEVRAGEIVGIAGVDGNGQANLAQAVLGVRELAGGTVALDGRADLSLRERLDRMAFIAEDRHRDALVLPLSIEDNLLLKDYRQRRFSTLGWLRFGAWQRHTRQLMQQFDIRAAGPESTVGRLSGGNQQKVVLARELYSPEKPLVLAVNPTRGLDVGATAFVLQKLLEARGRGAGVLLIHSDLDELLAVSDRIAVIYDGQLTATAWPQTTKEAIGQLMLGLEPVSGAPKAGGAA